VEIDYGREGEEHTSHKEQAENRKTKQRKITDSD
jgi:hypothetical protein